MGFQNKSKSVALIVLLIVPSFFSLVFIVDPADSLAGGLEYNKNSEPVCTIDNKALIKSDMCCLEYGNETLCRKIGTFQDSNFSVKCEYYMGIRKENVLMYFFTYELNNSGKFYPLVINLYTWPEKIVTDDFENPLNEEPLMVDTFPFVLSGNNRSLYFPENKNYEYYLSNSQGEYILYIYSKTSKNTDHSSIEMVAVSSVLNKSNFHECSPIYLYENPPTWSSFGPERTKIEIKKFFTGRMLSWHPELPYVELSLEICPPNESDNGNKTLVIKFNGISGMMTENVSYDINNKRWCFPEEGTEQIYFNYNSWLYPLSKYITTIKIDSNISFNGSQSLEIPGKQLLDAEVIYKWDEIKIEVYNNWWTCILLIFILLSYLPAISWFRKYLKDEEKTFSSSLVVYEVIPILFSGFSLLVNWIPLKSILFLVLLSSWVFIPLTFGLIKKYKR